MYESMSHQMIDQMFREDEELTEEEIEDIELAKGESAYYDYLDRQEYDRSVCY